MAWRRHISRCVYPRNLVLKTEYFGLQSILSVSDTHVHVSPSPRNMHNQWREAGPRWRPLPGDLQEAHARCDLCTGGQAIPWGERRAMAHHRAASRGPVQARQLLRHLQQFRRRAGAVQGSAPHNNLKRFPPSHCKNT